MRRQRWLICDWLSFYPSRNYFPDVFKYFQDCLMNIFYFYLQNSKKGKITLENISKLPVDNLNISVSSKDGEGESSCISLYNTRLGWRGSVIFTMEKVVTAGRLSRRFHYHCYNNLLYN